MKAKVLITGGSGLIGAALTRHLIAHNYEVTHLVRKRDSSSSVHSYIWDVKSKYIEPGALSSADYIIHLAGAGLFEHAWTEEYKKEIIDSRVKSAQLIFEELNKGNHSIKGFISASGISIYGPDTKELLVDEESMPSDDFLAHVTKKWEEAADVFQHTNCRVVKLRTGIVLSKKGGALEKMALPVKLGVGSPLASGKQYISWIHIDDICAMYRFAIENENMSGVYNAVSPNPCTNKTFIVAIAKVLKKAIVLPSVPAFVLKIVLGREKSMLALGGNNVSSSKISRLGFQFKYPILQQALENLLN